MGRVTTRRRVLRIRDGASTHRPDTLAAEEPMEIRVGGRPLTVTMRTPGADHALAAGFLLSEGIIRSVDDLGTLSHCGRTDQEGYGNALDVLPAPGVQLQWERVTASRRGTLTSAACGVCGREQIDDLLAREINPAVAMHGGWVELIDVKKNNVYLRLGGGCQGCGAADVTLKQGIEKAIRSLAPSVGEILDTTDHASGRNPYYAPAK